MPEATKRVRVTQVGSPINRHASQRETLTFALAGVPLLAAGVLACYVPARRAARVDATVALKDF